MSEHDQDEVFPPAPDRPPGQYFREGALFYLREALPDADEKVRQQLAEQMLRGANWLEEKWGANRHCPYCNNPGWEVGIPVQYRRSRVGQVSAAPMVPLYPVTCTNCGNTVRPCVRTPKSMTPDGPSGYLPPPPGTQQMTYRPPEADVAMSEQHYQRIQTRIRREIRGATHLRSGLRLRSCSWASLPLFG